MVSTWRDIARKIREKDQSAPQKVIASRLGLKESALSRYLSGLRKPDPAMAMRIASAYGIDASELGELSGLDAAGRVQLVEADAAGTPLSGVGAPLVAEDVAAGPGALPSVPDDRVYFFHRSYMVHHGWREADRDRFCCIRLGSKMSASSMTPTIPPKAVLLIDRKYPEERLQKLQRGICLVDIPDEGIAVKRVTIADGVLLVESDNPEPQHHARAISLKGIRIRDVIRGKVLSWTVEASTRE